MKTVTSKDGTKIAYELLGTGPALIYITGAICHRKFKPVLDDAKYFCTQFSVINYDRRGRGDSGDSPEYNLEKEVEDIEALIDSLGKKANLYGHSSGAVLAMEAAIRLPNKIDKVFTYDPSYVHNQEEKEKFGVLMRKVNLLISNKDYSGAVRSFLLGIGMPKFFVLLLPLMPGWNKLKALAPTLSYDMELTKELPPLAHLSGITLPLKIVCGQKSPESIKSVSKSISKAVRSSTFFELPNQDHMVNSRSLLPLLKDFFK
jgi:pimeloyl-ACP methyl ester carboxylesterase